jgi:hypothetical protein
MNPQPHPAVLFRELEGEAVLLDLGSGTYFGLNEVGTRIWQLLDRRVDPPGIVRALAAEFDADPATIERDVAALLDELAARRLIVDGAGQHP